MATATQTMQHEMFSARRFIGKDVFDVNGQHVGEIEDLVLSVSTACAEWGIVSTGGVLGIGEKYRIVPIQALSLESDSGRIMLEFGGDRLGNGPMYDRNSPPDWGDENWKRSVKSFYGIEAGGMGGGGEQAYRQGYEQGYQQAMQGQGTMSERGMQQGGMMQHGSMGGGMHGGMQSQQGQQGQQGQMQERRMGGSSGYTGPERRHERMQGSQMRPIGRQSSSMGGQSSMGRQEESGSRQRGDRDWRERT